MQLSQFMLALASATVASAKFKTNLGNRYTNHNCGVLHSEPQRAYKTNECIELETVGSMSMNFQSGCLLYQDHECKGEIVACFPSGEPDGLVRGKSLDGPCVDTVLGRWPKAKSFYCVRNY